MSKITATDAKNRFGQLLEMAQSEPVEIQKSGRTVGVLISREDFSVLQELRTRPKVRSEVDALLKASIRQRRSLYEALAK